MKIIKSYPILQGHYPLTIELSVLKDEEVGQVRHLLLLKELHVAQL